MSDFSIEIALIELGNRGHVYIGPLRDVRNGANEEAIGYNVARAELDGLLPSLS